MRKTRLFASHDLRTKNNSLNLIRLVLAWAVLVSHATILAGVGDGLIWKGENLGGWAVIGFFAISGFLISGSRCRSDGARYLLNRVTRIFPGYILSLVVVAFIFAPAAHLFETKSLDAFFGVSNTPANYVWGNILLRVNDYSVGTTLHSVPYPKAWNGSLWSLYFEFWCYIIIGIFLSWNVTRNRAWPTALLFIISVGVHAKIDVIAPYLGGNADFILLARMLPYFLGGAIMYTFSERLPLRWDFAALAAIAAFISISFVPHFGIQLAAPAFAYVILWLGSILPSPRIIQIHDISYGMYIFAFPTTQLLVLFGVHRHGFWLLILLTTLITMALASASWIGVERAVMRWSRGRKPWADLRSAAR